jgi:negative regulator of flagellin synthesis FlgM
MKIGNSPDGSASPTKAERPASRKAEDAVTTGTVRQTAQPATPAPSAQVAISSAAKLAAIAEGKFTINANAIADKLVANAQELLSARANKH